VAVIGFPSSLAQNPGSSLLLKVLAKLSGPFPLVPLGTSAIKALLAPLQKCTTRPEKANQRIKQLQRKTARKTAALQHAQKTHGPAFASCHKPGERPFRSLIAADQRHQALPSLGIGTPLYQ
jgi:hypothetical protein